MLQVKAVLFDLFDTLLLIKGGEAFYTPSLRKLYEFLAKNGVRVSFEKFRQAYFEVRDVLYAETSKKLEEPHFNIRVWQTLQKLDYNYSLSDPIISKATESFAKEFMNYVSLDEDAADALQRIYGKYKLGIVSNFAIPECAWELLERFDLKRFFDVIVISGEVNKRKPSPEIFHKALKVINADPSETVFVGDTLSIDVEGAKKVGMKAILILRGTSVPDMPKPVYTTARPDKVIRRLKELPTIIGDC